MASSVIKNVPTEFSGAFEQVRMVIGDALQLGSRGADLNINTLLLGNLPELDSMAVVTVITALEEHFQFTVEDDDDLAEAFVGLESLTRYVSQKSQK